MDNSYCCVPQCTSHGCKFPRTSFHRFPSVTENRGIRRLQWIARLRIGKEVTERMVVCGKHFKPTDFFPRTAGSHGLKRTTLKRNAVPSLNLPTSPECTDENERNTKLKTKNQKIRKSGGTTPEKSKRLCLEVNSQKYSYDQEEINCETSSSSVDLKHVGTSPCITRLSVIESPEDQEKIETKSSSSPGDEIYEEHMDASPCITRLRIMADDSSSVSNTTEHTSGNLEKYAQNCTVPLTPAKYKENSEFDFSIFKSSPDDSKETLTEKLDGMISVNELLQKKIKFYQNKCKMYEKEVNIMKGVIENLKLINSVTFDN